MAIDMIENNELSALGESRLKSMSFINEGNNYQNYIGDDFYNLFGSRRKKKNKFREDVRKLYDNFKTDCESLALNIDIVTTDLETLVKRSGGKSSLEIKEKIDETQIVLGELKKIQSQQQCVMKTAAAEKELQSAENIKTLIDLSDSSVAKAQAELAGLDDSKKDEMNTNTYIYIAGGVLAVGIIGVLIFKMNK
jgi:hypothetical protein